MRIVRLAAAVWTLMACSPAGGPGSPPADGTVDAPSEAGLDGGQDGARPDRSGSCLRTGEDCSSDTGCCSGDCRDGTCAARSDGGASCGVAGGECCDGSGCAEGTTCDGTTCIPCGGAGEPCCDASSCDPGLDCLGGECMAEGNACGAATCESCASTSGCGWCDDGSGCFDEQGSCPAEQWIVAWPECSTSGCADFEDSCTEDSDCCYGRCDTNDTCACLIRNQQCDDHEDCCSPLVCFEGRCGSI